jgi:hypothetical protein
MTMAKRIPMNTGDEYDALTKWKKYVHWKAGERKAIKRRYNRRERRKSITEVFAELRELCGKYYYDVDDVIGYVSSIRGAK